MKALDQISELLKSIGLSEYEIDDLLAKLLDEELPRLMEFKRIINDVDTLEDIDLKDDHSYYIELIDLLESLGIKRSEASDLFYKAHNELRLSECLLSELPSLLMNDKNRYC